MKHYSKQIFLFLLVLLFGSQSFAQTPSSFSIKGKINGIKDTTVFLAHYFGYNQQVIKDTAKVDSYGQFHFKGTKELPEGLYLIALPKGRYLDVVIGNTNFSFETDTTNLIGKMKVTGSKENELFFGFQQEMASKFEKLKQLDAMRRQKKDAGSEAAFKKQQTDIESFQKTWLEQNKGSFVVKLIKAAQEPEVPAYGKPIVTKADSSAMYQFQFSYYKSHFWDNFDLGDERLMRTPFYQKKLERYFEDLTVQQSDSISLEADKILSKVKGRDIRRYTIYKITSSYENPKILGVDGAFVHMAEKYYIGEPALWDTSTVRKMKERIAIVKPLLNGKPFPDMYLTDTLGREIDIRRIPADYTVVFIYDPECSHCRESAPKLAKMYPALKQKNVRVLAASIDRSAPKWKKFIKEFKFESMINGIDIHKNPQTGKEEYYTDFKNLFDVYATPVIYVLDKDKKIIAKRLPLEQIEDFIDFHKKQNIKK
jgi:thiol-disulfide isomerase/thioredoxin